MIKLNLNEQAFDIINSESAYWLGFISCESSISYHDKRYSFSIELSEKDEDHLNKLQNFLSSNRTLYKRTRTRRLKPSTSACLKISSKYMINKLIELGIGYKKSFRNPINNIIKYKGFIRGILDADGHLELIIHGDSKYPSITLSSSKNICDIFSNFLINYLKYDKFYYGKKPNSQAFDIKICGRRAYIVMNYLYNNDDIALDRKSELAKFILKETEDKYANENCRYFKID